MRKIIFLFSFVIISTLAYSIPAKRVTRTVVVDGQEVTLTLTGNEKVHFWLSEDGWKYQMNEDGSFTIFPEAAYQKALDSKKFELKNPESLIPNTTAFAKARAKRKVKYQGQKRGLVILAEFSDKTFTSTDNPREDYQKVVAAENYKESRNYGSVRDYFKAQSYGQFDFVLDVVGPVKLPQNMSYYGKNDMYGEDLNPGTMIWEACQAVDDEVDFSEYDWDGDGNLEQVFVIYAGYGEAQGGASNTIWPHAWSLSTAKEFESGIGSCVFDGVTIDSYACGPELAGGRGTKQDGIGTICHEFSHCFGLPDLYCTDDSHSNMTMESWSLMDYGSYAGDGYIPVSYTAYERWFCGWIEPTELSSPQFVKGMANIDENGESYVIYNDNNPNEYYLLQNIQKAGWNSAASGHGMLVLHVDYDQEAWEGNTVNNDKNHLRMTPICADNKRNATTSYGDTYPDTSNNTELTDFSTPAATLYNANTDGKKLMHKPITDIAERSDGLISFTFMGGEQVDAPTDLEANLVDGKITATWQPGEDNIVSYNIRYGNLDENAVSEVVIVDEGFEKCKSTSDSSLDMSSALNNYLTVPGFTGTKLFRGTEGLKMGTSKVDGQLLSPELNGEGGDIRVTIASKAYGTIEATLTVTVFEYGGKSPLYISEPLETGKEYTLDISGVTNSFQICVDAVNRCYLTKLQITDLINGAYANETLIEGITTMPFTFSPSMSAPKYWLQVQSVSQSGKTSEWSEIVVVENTTAIESVCLKDYCSSVLSSKQSPAYNLQGQRVSSDYRGIVIRNGKKYLTE